MGLMRGYTPLRHLISRHTRELLRRYAREGMLDTAIADRQVEDHFIDMSEAERALYDAVEAYIRTTYNQAVAAEKAAVGFVMTTYRRRLASSVHALRVTLERHRAAIETGGAVDPGALEDDAPDDETADEILDTEELAALEQRALASEERQDIDTLLARIARCPPDSKLARLKATIAELRRSGYEQTMVFTQYGDTMEFLREELRKDPRPAPDVLLGPGRRGPDGGRAVARDPARRRQAALPARRGRRAALHRRRRRRPQLPVLRSARELRHAVEPHARGAADRANRPPRATPFHRADQQPALRGHGGDGRVSRARKPNQPLPDGRGTLAAHPREAPGDDHEHRARRSTHGGAGPRRPPRSHRAADRRGRVGRIRHRCGARGGLEHARAPGAGDDDGRSRPGSSGRRT